MDTKGWVFVCWMGLYCAAFAGTTLNEGPGANTLVIDAGKGTATIAPEIYGQFAEHLGGCVYGGFWVGPDSPIPNVRGIRTDVVNALKKLNIPVLRWPGGCFADEYHWKEGIGPTDKRSKMVNSNWGMITETNAFGTHEFLDLCQMLGCKAYVAGNVGSGTPEEMQDWVEYMTFGGDSEMANLRRVNGRQEPWKIDYFGVGNENWGCGGNMTPEYYADVFKRYQTYVRNYSGNRITRIACGSSSDDFRWTEVVMSRAAGQMDMISLHHYVMSGDWGNKGRALTFNEQEWFSTLKKTLYLDEMIVKYKAIMDKYDKGKRVGLAVDEWGTWWDAEKGENPGFLYQQNTLRDAVVAGMFLNIFNNHADRVKMANIAQTNNVLQAMILTRGEKMLTTPTYHVFEMYKVHQGATLLDSRLECKPYTLGDQTLPSLTVSASKDKNGVIAVSLCNLDPEAAAQIDCQINGATVKKVSGRILTAEAMNAHNTFDKPEAIKPAAFDGGTLKDGKLSIEIPAKAIVVLTLE